MPGSLALTSDSSFLPPSLSLTLLSLADGHPGAGPAGRPSGHQASVRHAASANRRHSDVTWLMTTSIIRVRAESPSSLRLPGKGLAGPGPGQPNITARSRSRLTRHGAARPSGPLAWLPASCSGWSGEAALCQCHGHFVAASGPQAGRTP